jgi:hypothetical protein
MAPVELVAAVGQHQGHAGAQVADQEAQQVTGGLVRPVQVLHDKQHWAALGQVVQHPEQQLEQPRRGQRGRLLPTGLWAELGDEPSQLRAGAAQHPLQLLRVHGAGERAQRLDHRRIRQDPFPDIQAAPGECDGADLADGAEQFGDQAGLADAGLAPHQDDGRFPICGPPSSRLESLKLLDAADKGRAVHTAAHLAGIIPRDRPERNGGRRSRPRIRNQPTPAYGGSTSQSVEDGLAARPPVRQPHDSITACHGWDGLLAPARRLLCRPASR